MNAILSQPPAQPTAILFDLDGTLYRGAEPIPYAVESVCELRGGGAGIVYLTNNSSQTRTRTARSEFVHDAPYSLLSTTSAALASPNLNLSVLAISYLRLYRTRPLGQLVGEHGRWSGLPRPWRYRMSSRLKAKFRPSMPNQCRREAKTSADSPV